MSLLNAGALWLLPLVAVLVLLSRLRVEPIRRAVANLHLWMASTRDEQTLAAAARPSATVLLALQLAFLLLAIAGIAHPVIPWTSRSVAFVFDVSASMTARDASGSRIDEAHQRALATLDGLAVSTRVHLIGAGTTPGDFGRFRAGGAEIRQAIGAATAGAGGSDLDEALKYARAGGGDVYVFSDQPPPAGVNATWIQVGRPVDNIAITALAVRRSPTGSAGGQLLAEIFNYGSAPRTADVVFTRDSRPIGRRTIRLDARSASPVSVDVDDVSGDFSGSLEGNRDGLALDDARFAIGVRPGRVRVQLLTRATGPTFLERGLEANPDATVRVTRGLAGAPSVDTSADVVVCDECRELPAGNAGLLIVPPAGDDAPAAAPLTIGAASHPLVRDLGAVDVFARLLRSREDGFPGSLSTVVMRVGDEPAVVAGEQNGRRVVRVNLSLAPETKAGSDFLLTPGFPVFLANAIDWLSSQDERPQEIVAGTSPHWVWRGRTLAVPATDRAGVYSIDVGGSVERYAVNPATSTESDLRPPVTTPAAGPTDASAGPNEAGGIDMSTTLLLAALAALGAEWWYSQRRRPSRSAIAWRAAVAALIAGAAAGLQVPIRQGAAAVVVALDRSDSIGNGSARQSVARINRSIANMRSRDALGLVVFGADAALERRPSARAPVDAIRSAVAGSATNIEAALRLARSTLPSGGSRRIVLVSDGRETAGDALREAAKAAADGVRIDVMVPGQGPADRTTRPAVTNVTGPGDAREGEPFLVSVDVAGPAGATARVTLFRDGDPVSTRDVHIGSAGVASLAVPDSRADSRSYVYTAAVDGDEADASRPGAVVTILGRTRALYIASRPGPAADALAASGLQLVRVAPSAVPSAPTLLSPYGLLVLDAVGPDRLDAAQAGAVASYVDNGGGLLVLGSETTLDAPGYAGSRLGAVLPIDLRPRSGRRSPSTAFAIVFDKSGSMADREHGVQKIELARQAVMSVLGVTAAADPVGIVAFDAAPSIVVPLGAGRDSAAVAERLRAIEPGGSTAIAPAMDIAMRWLRDAQAPRRHALLISDGRTSPVDAERLRSAVAGQGIEVSVVAIGPDADRDFLERLARSTGGRAYFPADIRELPALAARDATASKAGARVDERVTLRATAHPALAGINGDRLPPLGGYIVSALKPGSDPLLVSHLDDPVLAAWRYGLGRSVVFTSDLSSSWAKSMAGWTGFRQLWSQTSVWAARADDNRNWRATLVDGAAGPHLIVDAQTSDDRFASTLDVDATVRTPSGGTAQVRLRATAPGRYESDLDADAVGAYTLSLTGRDRDSGAEQRVVRSFYWSSNRERAARGPDMPFLTRLSRITGGAVLAEGQSPFDAARPAERRDISSWLGAAGLAAFLADLARRRRAAEALARWWRSRTTSVPAAA